jgi:hypothetical protein
MTLVNGYVCRDCTDEELAKRGIDPAHPKDGAKGIKTATDQKNPAAPSLSQAELGVNRPDALGPVGTRLNTLG